VSPVSFANTRCIWRVSAEIDKYGLFAANERRCWMWDSIPKWVRYGVGVIVTIFVGIAIWYMSQ
jgi:hypothetical protein